MRVTMETVRRLVQAPFRVDTPVQLGRAAWLYLWLIANANASGHVCRVVGSVARELRVTERDIERWLARLEKVGAIRLQSRPPYLVVKLKFWSSGLTKAALKSSKSEQSHKEVPVSSKQQQIKAKQASSGEVGGVGEGEPLKVRLLRSLGQENAEDVNELIRRHTGSVLEKALGRVQRTPPSSIRKSKLALFRYLVNKFSKNPDDHT